MKFRKLALAALIVLMTTTVVNAAPNRPTGTPPSRGNGGSPPNTPPHNGGRGGMKPPTGGVVGKVPNQTPGFRPGMPARPAIAGPARLYPYQPGIIVKPQIIPFRR